MVGGGYVTGTFILISKIVTATNSMSREYFGIFVTGTQKISRPLFLVQNYHGRFFDVTGIFVKIVMVTPKNVMGNKNTDGEFFKKSTQWARVLNAHFLYRSLVYNFQPPYDPCHLDV